MARNPILDIARPLTDHAPVPVELKPCAAGDMSEEAVVHVRRNLKSDRQVTAVIRTPSGGLLNVGAESLRLETADARALAVLLMAAAGPNPGGSTAILFGDDPADPDHLHGHSDARLAQEVRGALRVFTAATNELVRRGFTVRVGSPPAPDTHAARDGQRLAGSPMFTRGAQSGDRFNLDAEIKRSEEI